MFTLARRFGPVRRKRNVPRIWTLRLEPEASKARADGEANRARTLIREIVQRLAEVRRELVMHSLDRRFARGIERLQRRRGRGGADGGAEALRIGDAAAVEGVQQVALLEPLDGAGKNGRAQPEIGRVDVIRA